METPQIVPKVFCGSNTIEACQLIELQQGKQANNEKYQAVGPFIDAHAGNDTGSTE